MPVRRARVLMYLIISGIRRVRVCETGMPVFLKDTRVRQAATIPGKKSGLGPQGDMNTSLNMTIRLQE